MSPRRCFSAFAMLFAVLPVLGADPEVLRIGMADSLMQEVPPSQRDQFGPQFRSLVHDFTGLKSVVLPGLDPFSAAKQLDAGKWHLGVFQGVEFAWLRGKHPELKPLMVAAYDPPVVRAVLLVKKGDSIKGFDDLKGKDAIIMQAKLHCQLFADKGAHGKAEGFFGKLLQTRSVEDALDNLLRGKVQGAIVDSTVLKIYENLQPGRFARLAVAAQSEPFPPTAIVYHNGTLSDSMLGTIRAGMLKANQNDRGREAMASFHITGFQQVPADFGQSLDNILKAYPAPK